MEIPRNLGERYSYEIQEILETPVKIESTIGDDAGEDVAECTRYLLSCCDSTSGATSIGRARGETLGDRTEVILLRQEPAAAATAGDRRETSIQSNRRRVIELSDSDCKLALRRQFATMDVERGSSNSRGRDAPMATAATTATAVDRENAEILRKLPPDTIVVRQREARASREDNSDYRESTETNSSSGGGSSSTSGCADAKVKRIPRAVRNKTRETVEVRRNPMRMSKKDIDKDFPQPRQRLLANSKRDICSNYESGKRSRASTMPYMNTRSVTRKMYTVGATYQAPTKRDETEWKEWPVHGMHERPVYHPQAGLAVEYLGRYFVSLDGLSYCEIIDEPEIEVVAVDPHCDDRRSSSTEKRPGGKAKAKSKRSSGAKDAWSTSLSAGNSLFETCMHGSLHCVLGYCSQVMTPSRKQAVEKRMMTKPTIPTVKTSASESAARERAGSFKDRNAASSADEFVDEAKLLEGYAIAMAQSVQSKSNASNGARRIATSTVASSSTATYLTETQKPTMDTSSRTVASSGRMSLPTLRGFPNASLVVLRSTGARTSGKTKDAKEAFKPIKLEDAPVNEQTLSSIYKKLVSADVEVASSSEKSPARGNFYALKRHAASRREYGAKKTILEGRLENARTIQVIKDAKETVNVRDVKINDSDGGMNATMNTKIGKNRAWCTSDTSEIARILSEYNRSTTRKSAIQVYSGSASRSVKTNFASSGTKSLARTALLWQKGAITEENRNASIDRDTSLDLSQGKWRRLPDALENIRTIEINDSDQNAWNGSSVSSSLSSSSSKNRQPSLKDRQANVSVFNYAREKSAAARKDLDKQRDVVTTDAKPNVATLDCSKDETEISKTQESLQELLENTAILYCAANGVHQDDLSTYIDTLDNKQSIQWLESWNNSIL